MRWSRDGKPAPRRAAAFVVYVDKAIPEERQAAIARCIERHKPVATTYRMRVKAAKKPKPKGGTPDGDADVQQLRAREPDRAGLLRVRRVPALGADELPDAGRAPRQPTRRPPPPPPAPGAHPRAAGARPCTAARRCPAPPPPTARPGRARRAARLRRDHPAPARGRAGRRRRRRPGRRPGPARPRPARWSATRARSSTTTTSWSTASRASGGRIVPDTVYLVPYGSAGAYEQEVEIHFHPPRTPEAQARRWDIAVAATSRASGTEVAAAPFTLGILPFEDYSLRVAPQRASGRRRGKYKLRVSNDSNAVGILALDAADNDGECRFGFESHTVEVAAGSSKTVGLSVHPPRQIWLGRPLERRFEVTSATGEAGEQLLANRVQESGGRRIPGLPQAPKVSGPRLERRLRGRRLRRPADDRVPAERPRQAVRPLAPDARAARAAPPRRRPRDPAPRRRPCCPRRRSTARRRGCRGGWRSSSRCSRCWPCCCSC